MIPQGYTTSSARLLLSGEAMRRALEFVIIFVTPVVLVSVGLVVIRLRRLSWRDDVGFMLPTRDQTLAWGAAFVALAVTAELVGWATGLEGSAGAWRGKYDAAALAVRILAVGVVFPLAEEFLFRGVMLGVLTRRFGAAVGVILSSAAFAAMHVQYEWYGIAFVLVDGLLFAICRLRTGSLYLPMLLHVCGNSYAVLERIFG